MVNLVKVTRKPSLEVAPTTMTFGLDLDSVKANHHATCLGQRSRRPNNIVQTHTQACKPTGAIALSGPLESSVQSHENFTMNNYSKVQCLFQASILGRR